MPALPSTAWSHLPNAALIDQVLASLKKNPEKWNTARYAARNTARDAARGAVQGAARGAARDAVWGAALDTERGKAWDAAWGAAWAAAWNTAWDAILALLAWDDCAKYLSMTSDQLSMWAALSESPAAILLQPYVRAREQIAQSTINGELTYENH